MKNKIQILLFSILLVSCEELGDLTNQNNTGDERDRIVDTWVCDENERQLKSLLSSYHVAISKNPDDSSLVSIYNFYALGSGKYINAVLGNKKLTVLNQKIQGFTINGNGIIATSYNRISWNYNVEYPSGEIYEVEAIFTRYE
ncbi:hypothetical protein ACFLSA_00560 [Bacteroidota bacterium]